MAERGIDQGAKFNPLDSRYPLLAGGAELTSTATFTVDNVGGTIVGKKLVAKQMVSGRIEGGQSVEVTPVFGEDVLVNISAICAKKISMAGPHELTVDDIAADKRLDELPNWASQVIDDITLGVEETYLEFRNIPDSMVTVTRTTRDIWEVINILRFKESPIPGLSLAEAKLQLSNGWTYSRAAKLRALWAEGKTEEQLKKGWPYEEYIKEITAEDIRGTEATL